MEKRGDLSGALEVFEKALEIDEENKMARFRKARVLMGMERYHVSCYSRSSRAILVLSKLTQPFHFVPSRRTPYPSSNTCPKSPRPNLLSSSF
jgi:hypothetical protein